MSDAPSLYSDPLSYFVTLPTPPKRRRKGTKEAPATGAPPGTAPTPPALVRGPSHGVAGLTGVVPRPPVAPPAIPAEQRADWEAQIGGPLDRTLANLARAHFAIFGTWPDYSLTADVLQSGEVSFDTFAEAYEFFRTVKEGMGPGTQWKLDPAAEETLPGSGIQLGWGSRNRKSGYGGFSAETDILDPGMIASFAPQSVSDFLVGPGMKHTVEGKQETFRYDALRLDEMLVALPRQWAISQLGTGLRSKAARHNPDLDADEALMRELNVYLAERVPVNYAPKPTARWQLATEESLRMLQQQRAMALYMASNGEDEDAESFLRAQGMANIIQTLDEQVRVPADPTGRADAAKREMVLQWYLNTRLPHESERAAIHQLANINEDVVPVAALEMVGSDHVRAMGGFLAHALGSVAGFLQLDDVVASDEFKTMARWGAPVAGEMWDAFNPVVGGPLGLFVDVYNEYATHYTAALIAGSRSDGIVGNTIKSILIGGGVALTATGIAAPVGVPMVATGLLGTDVHEWAKGGPFAELVANIYDASQGQVEWFDDFWDEYKKAEKGLSSDPMYWGKEILRDWGVTPEAHPFLTFLTTFGLETARDLPVQKGLNIAGTYARTANWYANARKLGRSWLHVKSQAELADNLIKPGGKLVKGEWQSGQLSDLSKARAVARLMNTFSFSKQTALDVYRAGVSEGVDGIRRVINEAQLSTRTIRKGALKGTRGSDTRAIWQGGQRFDVDSWAIRRSVATKWLYDPTSRLSAQRAPTLHHLMERMLIDDTYAIDYDAPEAGVRHIGYVMRQVVTPLTLRFVKDPDARESLFVGYRDSVRMEASSGGYDELARLVGEAHDYSDVADILAGAFANPDEYIGRPLSNLLASKSLTAGDLGEVGMETAVRAARQTLMDNVSNWIPQGVGWHLNRIPAPARWAEKAAKRSGGLYTDTAKQHWAQAAAEVRPDLTDPNLKKSPMVDFFSRIDDLDARPFPLAYFYRGFTNPFASRAEKTRALYELSTEIPMREGDDASKAVAYITSFGRRTGEHPELSMASNLVDAMAIDAAYKEALGETAAPLIFRDVGLVNRNGRPIPPGDDSLDAVLRNAGLPSLAQWRAGQRVLEAAPIPHEPTATPATIERALERYANDTPDQRLARQAILEIDQELARRAQGPGGGARMHLSSASLERLRFQLEGQIVQVSETKLPPLPRLADDDLAFINELARDYTEAVRQVQITKGTMVLEATRKAQLEREAQDAARALMEAAEEVAKIERTPELVAYEAAAREIENDLLQQEAEMNLTAEKARGRLRQILERWQAAEPTFQRDTVFAALDDEHLLQAAALLVERLAQPLGEGQLDLFASLNLDVQMLSRFEAQAAGKRLGELADMVDVLRTGQGELVRLQAPPGRGLEIARQHNIPAEFLHEARSTSTKTRKRGKVVYYDLRYMDTLTDKKEISRIRREADLPSTERLLGKEVAALRSARAAIERRKDLSSEQLRATQQRLGLSDPPLRVEPEMPWEPSTLTRKELLTLIDDRLDRLEQTNIWRTERFPTPPIRAQVPQGQVLTLDALRELVESDVGKVRTGADQARRTQEELVIFRAKVRSGEALLPEARMPVDWPGWAERRQGTAVPRGRVTQVVMTREEQYEKLDEIRGSMRGVAPTDYDIDRRMNYVAEALAGEIVYVPPKDIWWRLTEAGGVKVPVGLQPRTRTAEQLLTATFAEAMERRSKGGSQELSHFLDMLVERALAGDRVVLARPERKSTRYKDFWDLVSDVVAYRVGRRPGEAATPVEAPAAATIGHFGTRSRLVEVGWRGPIEVDDSIADDIKAVNDAGFRTSQSHGYKVDHPAGHWNEKTPPYVEFHLEDLSTAQRDQLQKAARKHNMHFSDLESATGEYGDELTTAWHFEGENLHEFLAELVPQPKAPAAAAPRYTLHSGGARGADSAWGEEGAAYGVVPRHYYAEGQPTPAGNVPLTPAELAEGEAAVSLAAVALGKHPPTRATTRNLILRNYHQVKNADEVFAVGTLEGDVVAGGTGWAVEMAKDAGKTVHVFDQSSKRWYRLEGGRVIEEETPTLTPNFAGIGSRELTPDGRAAIRDVYEKTFGGAPAATAAVVPTGRVVQTKAAEGINVGRVTSGGEYPALGNPFRATGKDTTGVVARYATYLDEGIQAGPGNPVHDEFMALVDRIQREGDTYTLRCPVLSPHSPCHADELQKRVDSELARRSGTSATAAAPEAEIDRLLAGEALDIGDGHTVQIKLGSTGKEGVGGHHSRRGTVHTITIDETILRQDFDNQAWAYPRSKYKGVVALSRNTFTTYEQWKRFVVLHELIHARMPSGTGVKLATKENQANMAALRALGLEREAQRIENLLGAAEGPGVIKAGSYVRETPETGPSLGEIETGGPPHYLPGQLPEVIETPDVTAEVAAQTVRGRNARLQSTEFDEVLPERGGTRQKEFYQGEPTGVAPTLKGEPYEAVPFMIPPATIEAQRAAREAMQAASVRLAEAQQYVLRQGQRQRAAAVAHRQAVDRALRATAVREGGTAMPVPTVIDEEAVRRALRLMDIGDPADDLADDISATIEAADRALAALEFDPETELLTGPRTIEGNEGVTGLMPVPHGEATIKQLHFAPYNYRRLSKFAVGGAVARMEQLNATKLFFGTASLDDITRFYKTVVMLKVATMLRIPLADEFVRLIFTEHVNPVKAWRQARQLEYLNKLAHDVNFRIAGLIERSTGRYRWIDWENDKKSFGVNYLRIRGNELAKPEWRWYYYGHFGENGLDRGSEAYQKIAAANRERRIAMVNEFLTDHVAEDEDLATMVRELLAAGLDEDAFMAIGVRRGGPLRYASWLTHRLFYFDGRTTRQLVSGSKPWAKGILEHYHNFADHPVFGKDWGVDAGATARSLGRDISTTESRSAAEQAAQLGSRSDLAGFSEFSAVLDRAGFRNPDLDRLNAELAVAVRENPNLAPTIAGYDEGIDSLGIPIISYVPDKVFGLLSAFGTRMNEMMYAHAFNMEKAYLTQAAKEADKVVDELLIERQAAHAAREYVFRTMFNGTVYGGEDMMRNIFLFLPAYRQFFEYWVPQTVKKPVSVGGFIVRANQDKEYLDWQRLPGPLSAAQVDLSQVTFLVNQGDNSLFGWLPGGGPAITFPISLMGTIEGKGSQWGQLSQYWPFTYATPFRALNSPLDKMVYGVTGQRLPWPLGTDPSRDPWLEMMQVRAEALKGERPQGKGFPVRVRALAEGFWNFFVPYSLRVTDKDVESLVKARQAYARAKTPAEAERVLDAPGNEVFRDFVAWQNLPSSEQLDFMLRHPQIIPFMVTGFVATEGQERGKVGFLWSEMRKGGVANPEVYVSGLQQRYARIQNIINATAARKTVDEEEAWAKKFFAQIADRHEYQRLRNEWQNSTGDFGPNGYFTKQGHPGRAYLQGIVNTRYAGIADTFAGISSYDTDAFRLAQFMEEWGGPAKKLLQMSPNYQMYMEAKLTKAGDATRQLAKDLLDWRMPTRLSAEQIRDAGYQGKQLETLQRGVAGIDAIWNEVDQRLAPLGKNGYATTEGRAILKAGRQAQLNLIHSNRLLEDFLGEGTVSLFRKSHLATPAWKRTDFVDLSKMDSIEREMFYHLTAQHDLKVPYIPAEGKHPVLPRGKIIGYVPIMKGEKITGYKAKVKIGNVVGVLPLRSKPKEHALIDLSIKQYISLIHIPWQQVPDKPKAVQAYRTQLEISLPDWAQGLVKEYVRAEAWRQWLVAAGIVRRSLRENVNEHYSGAKGFSLSSKPGLLLKNLIIRYGAYLAQVSPEFAKEWRSYNDRNFITNATLNWYL